ncbi:YtxH domain-containing protein [Spirosoma sp. KUDC1026]|uniref:YtxH domain-containing protein n=1 Tax=Spirosoma sp. KUDC1026 TaxID=2745947 RepID=UPI00159BA980|nr:YtxH domain-containing protein [Spirosoma sp. KUDC1026]QKZ14030.1 YtxH domain-containing protein [Spirosoma sp. KUDC1026]
MSFDTLFESRKQPLNYLGNQTFLSGLVTGLVAGVAVGLLIAPRSGKKMRKQILDTVNGQTKEAQHQWDKVKSQAKETIDNVKTNASLVANKAMDEFDVYADKAETKSEELAKQVQSGINRLGDAAKIS